MIHDYCTSDVFANLDRRAQLNIAPERLKSYLRSVRAPQTFVWVMLHVYIDKIEFYVPFY